MGGGWAAPSPCQVGRPPLACHYDEVAGARASGGVLAAGTSEPWLARRSHHAAMLAQSNQASPYDIVSPREEHGYPPEQHRASYAMLQ